MNRRDFIRAATAGIAALGGAVGLTLEDRDFHACDRHESLSQFKPLVAWNQRLMCYEVDGVPVRGVRLTESVITATA